MPITSLDFEDNKLHNSPFPHPTSSERPTEFGISRSIKLKNDYYDPIFDMEAVQLDQNLFL